jgi:hypothetical protein
MCAFTGGSGAVRQAEFFVDRQADREILEGALERHRIEWEEISELLGAPVA